ncbi:MAG: aspartate kinase [Pirellulales bacterium]|nr:aspartate kinase [Pirellulales bacterium]
MSLIVQKFGGTSVATTEKILAAARKAIRAQQQGHQVVMVVSAMGHETDHLLELAHQITDQPSARELDMLLSTGEQVSVALMAMAIQSLGSRAISLTGAQIGIKTDSTHTKARIQSISTERMQRLLNEGNIVIAAGFQGIDEDFNITTLGRGGSDTTAVALAAVLKADSCEIYTDVDGVYTTDPRLLPEARRVRQISYDEMLELASLGAGVMHSRSIEFGKKFGVPIHVRTSFSDITGTMIVADPESPNQAVCGAALVKDEARITVEGVPDRPGASLAIFKRIAAERIAVDMIVQNIGAEGRATISFTVPKDELKSALALTQAAADELGAKQVTSDDNVAKVSVVGLGMANQTGVATKLFAALAAAGVNIQAITTSEIKISALIAREQAQTALRVAHAAFELEKDPPALNPESVGRQKRNGTTAEDVVRRLQAMEGLAIDEVELDDTQARVTVNAVPNKPGIAARLFEEIAAAGIFVDMIVQSFGGAATATISFTVPQSDLEKSLQVAERLAREFGCGGVTNSPKLAKLSVLGIGVRTNTSVAMRVFESLAKAGINLDMLSTSEVRLNVVVDGANGRRALETLQKAFADAV